MVQNSESAAVFKIALLFAMIPIRFFVKHSTREQKKIKRIACKILNLTYLGIVMRIGTTMKASMAENLPALMSKSPLIFLILGSGYEVVIFIN